MAKILRKSRGSVSKVKCWPKIWSLLHSGTPERGAGGSRRPSCLSVGGAVGAKVPFLNAMICFLIVNMIQRRSYKLKTSTI